MKTKTARRWLSRNSWAMARALVLEGVGKPKTLWGRYWLCLSLTSVLFRRFG